MEKEEFDRDKDVIKSEEFDKLEEKEVKKSLVKRFLRSNPKQVKEKKEDKEIIPAKLTEGQVLTEFYSLNEKFDKTLIQVEKLSGKLELEQSSNAAFGERLMELSSQLGELRSVIVSKSKFFDAIEEQFNQIVEEFKSIKPEKIQEQLEKYNKRLVSIESSVERNYSRSNQLEKEIAAYRNQMAKIESFEALLDALKNNQMVLKEINNSKTIIERLATKSEFIYSELSEKLTKIDSFDARINSNDNSLREIIKSLDKVQLKLSNAAPKSEVNEIKQQISQIKTTIFKKDLEKFFSLFKKSGKIIPEKAISNIDSKEIASSEEKIGKEKVEKDEKIEDKTNTPETDMVEKIEIPVPEIIQKESSDQLDSLEKTKEEEVTNEKNIVPQEQISENEPVKIEQTIPESIDGISENKEVEADEVSPEISSDKGIESSESVGDDIESEPNPFLPEIPEIKAAQVQKKTDSSGKKSTDYRIASEGEEISTKKKVTRSRHINKKRIDKKSDKKDFPSTIKPLIMFIKMKKSEGFSAIAIRKAILKRGWPKSYVDYCMDYVS